MLELCMHKVALVKVFLLKASFYLHREEFTYKLNTLRNLPIFKVNINRKL